MDTLLEQPEEVFPTSSEKSLSIAKSAAALFFLQLGIKALTLAWSFYLARRLGVQLYGLWAKVLALVSIFGVLQGFGTLSLIIKEVAQNPKKFNQFQGAAFLIYGSSALCAFVLVVFSSWLLGYEKGTVLLCAIAALSFLILFPGIACQSLLYGREEYILYTLIYLAGTIFYLACGVFAVESGYGVAGVFVALCLGYCLSSFLLLQKTIRKYGFPIFQGALQTGSSLFKLGIPLLLGNIFMEVMVRADRILIDRFLGEVAVGYYHAAFNLSFLSKETILLPIVTAVFSRLSYTYAHEPENFHELFEKTCSGLLLLALPMAAFGMVFSSSIIEFFYGKAFAESGKLFTLLVWTIPLLFVLNFLQTIFVIQNRPAVILWTSLLGVGLNLSLNIFLLPPLGVVSAAIAALLSLAGMISFTFCLLKNIRFNGLVTKASKILFACLLPAILLNWIKQTKPEVNFLLDGLLLIAGLAAYALLLILTGAMKGDELLWLKRQIKISLTRSSRSQGKDKK